MPEVTKDAPFVGGELTADLERSRMSSPRSIHLDPSRRCLVLHGVLRIDAEVLEERRRGGHRPKDLGVFDCQAWRWPEGGVHR